VPKIQNFDLGRNFAKEDTLTLIGVNLYITVVK
jgi:hypothetical protein